MLMDRDSRDEGFVVGAYKLSGVKEYQAKGRDKANQTFFNGFDTDKLQKPVRAAVIEAAKIYRKFGVLSSRAIDELRLLETKGEFRAFIDKYHEKALEVSQD